MVLARLYQFGVPSLFLIFGNLECVPEDLVFFFFFPIKTFQKK